MEGTTKGGRSRTISLDRDTVTVLRDHRRQSGGGTAGRRFCLDRYWRPGLRDRMGRAALSRHRDRADEQADQCDNEVGPSPPARPLPARPLHDLRPPLHATTLLLAGVPVHVVAVRLGHADPAVTFRVYSHVLREHAAGVGDIFAQAVQAALAKPLASRAGRTNERRFRCSTSGQGRIELPTFRFSGVADAQLRLDVLVVRGCLRLRQGAGGWSSLPSRLPSEMTADLPLPGGESGSRVRSPGVSHARLV